MKISDPKKLFLGGIGQGASMVLASFLRLQSGTNLGKVIAINGIVPIEYKSIIYENSITPIKVSNCKSCKSPYLSDA